MPAALAAWSAAPALPAWTQNASTKSVGPAAASTAQTQTAPPSAAEFFAHPAFVGAQLSPDGQKVYNTGSQQFVRLGDAMPGLRGRAMGRMQGVQIKTRDGRQMPAWLSLPPGEARRPLPLEV